MRIVSLLPAASEIVALLGAAHELVGRSHECDFPESLELSAVPILTSQTTVFTNCAEVDRAVSVSINAGGSLYRLDEARLQKLRPDLIITQDVCEVCSIDLATVRRVAERIGSGARILSLNPATFEDVLDDVVRVGRAIGREIEAEKRLVELRERFFRASEFVNGFVEPEPAMFLEWTDPLYVGGHWTAQLIERAGAAHPLNPTAALSDAGAGAGGQMAHRRAGRSIRVSREEVVRAKPRHIVVCPCGLSLERAASAYHELEMQDWWQELPAVRTGRVALVDGSQMFNRPGPRLVDAFEWLVGWLHERPELAPHGFPWRRA